MESHNGCWAANRSISLTDGYPACRWLSGAPITYRRNPSACDSGFHGGPSELQQLGFSTRDRAVMAGGCPHSRGRSRRLFKRTDTCTIYSASCAYRCYWRRHTSCVETSAALGLADYFFGLTRGCQQRSGLASTFSARLELWVI